MTPCNPYAILLCLSERHGDVDYHWEKQFGPCSWDDFNFPNTCLVFTDCPGGYRCSVEGNFFTFSVEAAGASGLAS